jgi:hypothetical protein
MQSIDDGALLDHRNRRVIRNAILTLICLRIRLILRSVIYLIINRAATGTCAICQAVILFSELNQNDLSPHPRRTK